MKFSARLSFKFILMTYLISTVFSLRFGLSKNEADTLDTAAITDTAAASKQIDDISDKDLEMLLKDPKYAALAEDVVKPSGAPSTSTSKSDESLLLKNMDLDLKTSVADTKPKWSKGKLDSKLAKDDPLASIDYLSKTLGNSDPLKEFDFLGGANSSKSFDKKKEKKKEEEEKFKKFDFMSKQQARYLIEVLKQPAFFSMLPSEAQQIVNVCLLSF